MSDVTPDPTLTPSERERINARWRHSRPRTVRDVLDDIEAILRERPAQSGEADAVASAQVVETPASSPAAPPGVLTLVNDYADAVYACGKIMGADEGPVPYEYHLERSKARNALLAALDARPAVSIEAIRDVLDEHKAWIPDVGRRDHLARVIAACLSTPNAERTDE